MTNTPDDVLNIDINDLTIAEVVEIEALTGQPLDALGQGGAGDVLDALHQPDEALAIGGTNRGEAHPAGAEHDGGGPVDDRGLQVRVPGDLTVVVGVQIDKAGGDVGTAGVDGLGGIAGAVA